MADAGLRGTGDWGTDERPKDYREGILWMNPNGDTPLLGLTAKATGKKKVATDPEFNWWAEPVDIVRLQVAGAVGASETLITVDSVDPSISNLKLNYGKATHLSVGDILMVEPAADAAVDDYERVIVTAVHSETQFSVARGASGTTPATIADDVFLLQIGSAFEEGTAEPGSTTRNPIKYYNYTQIFKTVYELTGTAENTDLRTGDPLANEKKRRMWDHNRKLEMSMLWGTKSESIGPNGKPIRTMDGWRSFVPSTNTTILGNSWGLAAGGGGNLMDAISPVFDYDSKAGDTRVAFVGNGTLNAINKAIINSAGAAGIKIEWGTDKKLWGMNVRELLFPQGRILLKTHPLMNRHTMYNNSMCIFDFSCITYVPMKGRDTKPKDNIQDDGEDVTRGMWQTECSMLVDMGGQTQGYIGNFGATLA